MTDKSNQDSNQDGVSPDPFAAVSKMWENWVALMGEVPEGFKLPSMAIPGLDNANSGMRENSLMMAELYRLAMVHGYQYLYRIAAKNMQYYPILADKLANMKLEDQTSEKRGECLDELKAWIREITDASFQESRKFQQDFETLIDDIWFAGLSTDEEQADYKRRHAAKN